MAEVLQPGQLAGDPHAVRASLRRIQPHGLTVFQQGAQETAVVFVHGLTGHKLETWHDFPALLAQHLSPVCGIGFFGYPTTVFSLRHVIPLLRPYDMKSKARELADELIAAQAQLGWRRLVLVAHSLGGLIVLGALHTCAERLGDRDRDLLRSIKELAFFGTPFLGSDRVGRLAALLSADMRALFRGDAYRAEVIAWTHGQQISDLLRLGSTYARVNVLYSATDFWVNAESARARFPGDRQFNASHTALCKPRETTERPYLFLAEVIARVAQTPPSPERSSDEPATGRRIYSPDDPQLPAVQKLYEDRLPSEERVPWSRVRESLEEASAAPGDSSLNLRYLTVEIARGQVCGFATALTVNRRRYAWFAYLVSAPGVALGIGRRLAQQLAREIVRYHRDCLGFVFEVDDPEALLISDADRSRRRARIRLYQRLGPIYHVAGLNYAQPRLAPGSRDPEPPMRLMFSPIPGTSGLKYLTRDEVGEMLDLVCTVQANAFRNHPDARAYQDYLRDWRARHAKGLPRCVQLVLK